MRGKPFSTTLVQGDGTGYLTAGDITCTLAVWARLWEYIVKPQQVVRPGFGSPAMPDNQGYLFIKLYDDTATNSAEEAGMVRLSMMNARETIKHVIWEGRTELSGASKTDRRLKVPLPEMLGFPGVGEDSKLVIEFRADASDTVVKTPIGTAAGLGGIMLPVTIYQ